MTRILADVPVDGIKGLDARAAGQGKSRASVLRAMLAVKYPGPSQDEGNRQ